MVDWWWRWLLKQTGRWTFDPLVGCEWSPSTWPYVQALWVCTFLTYQLNPEMKNTAGLISNATSCVRLSESSLLYILILFFFSQSELGHFQVLIKLHNYHHVTILSALVFSRVFKLKCSVLIPFFLSVFSSPHSPTKIWKGGLKWTSGRVKWCKYCRTNHRQLVSY